MTEQQDAKIYIDGHAGTTGLRIREWLAGGDGIEVLTLPEASRKDDAGRRAMIETADIAVLCLPDEAARQAAEWAAPAGTRLLDTSTAHRIHEDWIYGIPELCPGQRERIRDARRVANSGCYALAFILLVRPLIEAGLISSRAPLSIHALSGYSGGGRQLIEKWQDPAGPLVGQVFEAPYALDRVHKHIPEMMEYTGIAQPPQFIPAVGPFACGMRVQVPLHAGLLEGEGPDRAERVYKALESRYSGEPFVRVQPIPEPGSIDEQRFDPRRCNDTNSIELSALPHPSGHVLLVAILDNLGKGACGTAIQSLNLMLGREETTSLPSA